MDPYLIYGGYIFAGLGFAFTFAIYKMLKVDIKELWTQITNHQAHRFQDIEKRLDNLEDP